MNCIINQTFFNMDTNNTKDISCLMSKISNDTNVSKKKSQINLLSIFILILRILVLTSSSYKYVLIFIYF